LAISRRKSIYFRFRRIKVVPADVDLTVTNFTTWIILLSKIPLANFKNLNRKLQLGLTLTVQHVSREAIKKRSADLFVGNSDIVA